MYLFLFLMCVTPFVSSSEPQLENLGKPWLVIFLDIDGVLYREPLRHDFWEERHEKMVELFGKLDHYLSFHYDVATAHYFDKIAVSLLENFIDEMSLQYNVGIVLSSAWREGRTLEQIREVFSPWIFSAFIIDKTVDTGFRDYTQEEIKNFQYGFPSRADQVNHWLYNHSEMNIASFIILDDQDSGFSKRFPNQFIRVNKSYLSLENMETAKTIINAGFVERDACLTRPFRAG